MSRLPPLDPDRLTAQQRRAYDTLASGPRGGVRGPFQALVYTPELAERTADLGEYLRYGTRFPDRLSKLAILLVARASRCGYAWNGHVAAGIADGLSPELVDELRRGGTPEFARDDEGLVHDLTTQLLRDHRVSDATWDAATDAFDREGVIELVALIGYYGMVAALLNAHEIRVPDGVADPFEGTGA